MIDSALRGALFTLALVAAAHPVCGGAQPIATVRNWNGIGLVQAPECNCCGLVFPDGFGANNPAQLKLLRELAGSEGRAEELGCNFRNKREALQHLTALATKQQDRGAALIVLRADSEQGVDLGGGELSETVGSEFMVPVLLKFKEVTTVLDPALSKHVARKVCASSLTVGNVDIPQLTNALRAKRLGGLATTVEQTCTAMSRGKD